MESNQRLMSHTIEIEYVGVRRTMEHLSRMKFWISKKLGAVYITNNLVGDVTSYPFKEDTALSQIVETKSLTRRFSHLVNYGLHRGLHAFSFIHHKKHFDRIWVYGLSIVHDRVF